MITMMMVMMRINKINIIYIYKVIKMYDTKTQGNINTRMYVIIGKEYETLQ